MSHARTRPEFIPGLFLTFNKIGIGNTQGVEVIIPNKIGIAVKKIAK